MISFFRAYKAHDPSLKSYAEVLLLPGPRALFFHFFAHGLYKLRLFFFARFVSELSRFLSGIEIHPGAKIGRNFVIDHGMGVVIGETAVVGDDCFIFHSVTLGGVDNRPGVQRHPHLGNGVIVGTGAKVLGNIKVGARVKIGAGAIVLTDCPDGATMIGVPAKPVYTSIPDEALVLQT